MNNEYDKKEFFIKYASMPRSKEGLSKASEWSELKPLFPNLKNKKVLDLGCGYGWHSKFALDEGADEILGLDLSSKMIEEAKIRNNNDKIKYLVCGINEYEYPKNYYDLVVSNLALHYIEDLDEVFKNVYNTLKDDGVFLFNIEHPTFTSGINQDWIYEENGNIKYWAIDDYFKPGKRKTKFLGCDVIKYHHTLTQILMGLLNIGFEIKVVKEVEPTKEMMELPEMKNELRRPMMLLVKAIKK